MPPSLPATACPIGQFRSEYYNNRSLSGSPTFTKCESDVNYDWGWGGPGNGVSDDNFSVLWVGHFNFVDGNYTFRARADDGIKVWVDNYLIINEWKDQATTEYKQGRYISTGEHEVRVEYYENAGRAVAEVSWWRISNQPNETYYWTKPIETERGGLIISEEAFPEGRGELIPIVVPDVINDSNATIDDSTWSTLKTIETYRGDFDWIEFFASLPSNLGGPPDNEYINATKSVVFSLVSGSLLSAQLASSQTKLKVIIQKDTEGKLRAVLQLADSGINTSIRKLAGTGWHFLVLNTPVLHHEYISKKLYTAFQWKPDTCYAPGIQFDSAHIDDEYIGYISFTQGRTLTYTPKIYANDGFKVVRGKVVILGILVMPTDVFEVHGNGYLSLFENPLGGEVAVRVSKLLDSSGVTLLSED